MKPLLIVFVLVVVAVVGLGFYLGWFSVASDGADGKGHITLTVDKEKIQEDKEKTMDKVHDLGHQGKDKAKATTEQAKD
jgi:preprotein translocase subunit SecF